MLHNIALPAICLSGHRSGQHRVGSRSPARQLTASATAAATAWHRHSSRASPLHNSLLFICRAFVYSNVSDSFHLGQPGSSGRACVGTAGLALAGIACRQAALVNSSGPVGRDNITVVYGRNYNNTIAARGFQPGHRAPAFRAIRHRWPGPGLGGRDRPGSSRRQAPGRLPFAAATQFARHSSLIGSQAAPAFRHVIAIIIAPVCFAAGRIRRSLPLLTFSIV